MTVTIKTSHKNTLFLCLVLGNNDKCLYSLQNQNGDVVPWVLSCFSNVWFFVTLWTVACQAPLSMGILQQEYWSGLPRPPPGDLPHPGIEPTSPAAPCTAGKFHTAEPPGKPMWCYGLSSLLLDIQRHSLASQALCLQENCIFFLPVKI